MVSCSAQSPCSVHVVNAMDMSSLQTSRSVALLTDGKPSLPLLRSQAENQKKYAEFDNRFKNSKVLQDLLEKSKKNKEK